MAAKCEYMEIRNSLCCLICPTQHLNKMKNKLSQEIDSKRVFDRIKTIPHLLQVLERRDSLNAENIDAFRTIASIYSNSAINTLIAGYGKRKHIPVQFQDFGQTPRLPKLNGQNRNQDPSNVQVLENPVIPALANDPDVEVHDLICSDIGKKWKDLARALGVKEGYIDLLEERFPRIHDRARAILVFHKEKNRGNKWTLCNALDKARRKDLSIEVQGIYEKYNII